MQQIDIPDELVPKIVRGELGIRCPLDETVLRLIITTDPYRGGASRSYICRGCCAEYFEGAVIRAALGDSSFLESRAQEYHARRTPKGL